MPYILVSANLDNRTNECTYNILELKTLKLVKGVDYRAARQCLNIDDTSKISIVTSSGAIRRNKTLVYIGKALNTCIFIDCFGNIICLDGYYAVGLANSGWNLCNCKVFTGRNTIGAKNAASVQDFSEELRHWSRKDSPSVDSCHIRSQLFHGVLNGMKFLNSYKVKFTAYNENWITNATQWCNIVDFALKLALRNIQSDFPNALRITMEDADLFRYLGEVGVSDHLVSRAVTFNNLNIDEINSDIKKITGITIALYNDLGSVAHIDTGYVTGALRIKPNIVNIAAPTSDEITVDLMIYTAHEGLSGCKLKAYIDTSLNTIVHLTEFASGSKQCNGDIDSFASIIQLAKETPSYLYPYDTCGFTNLVNYNTYGLKYKIGSLVDTLLRYHHSFIKPNSDMTVEDMIDILNYFKSGKKFSASDFTSTGNIIRINKYDFVIEYIHKNSDTLGHNNFTSDNAETVSKYEVYKDGISVFTIYATMYSDIKQYMSHFSSIFDSTTQIELNELQREYETYQKGWLMPDKLWHNTACMLSIYIRLNGEDVTKSLRNSIGRWIISASIDPLSGVYWLGFSLVHLSNNIKQEFDNTYPYSQYSHTGRKGACMMKLLAFDSIDSISAFMSKYILRDDIDYNFIKALNNVAAEYTKGEGLFGYSTIDRRSEIMSLLNDSLPIYKVLTMAAMGVKLGDVLQSNTLENLKHLGVIGG